MNPLDDLRSADVAVRLGAVEALAHGRGDDAAVDALARCLADASKAVRRRAADALAALATRDAGVRRKLVPLLASPDADTSWGAAFALGRLGTPPADVLPVLLESLGRDDGDVRWAAAEMVLRLEDAAAACRAIEALATGGSAAQRKMALYCLRDLGAWSPARDGVVSAALADADPGVRLAGMSLAARSAPERAATAARVVALLDDPDPGVRRAAAATLGTIGVASVGVLAGLQAAAAGSDPAMRRAADRALRALRGD